MHFTIEGTEARELTHLPVKRQVGPCRAPTSRFTLGGRKSGGLEAKPREGGADGQQRSDYFYYALGPCHICWRLCQLTLCLCQNLESRSLVQSPGSSPWWT